MVERGRGGKGGRRAPKTLFSVGRKSASQDDAVEESEHYGSPVVEAGDAAQSPEVGFECPACGAPMPVEARFCGECGEPLTEEVGEGVLPPPPVGVLEEGEVGEVVEYEFVEVEEDDEEDLLGGEPVEQDAFDEEAEKAAAAAVAVGSSIVSEESAEAETFLIDDDVTRPAEFVDKLSGPGTRGGAQPDAPGRPATNRTPLYVGGGIAALLLVVLGVVLMGGGGGRDDERVQVGAGPVPTVRVDKTTTVPSQTTQTTRRTETTRASTTTTTRASTTETSRPSTTNSSSTTSTTSTTSTAVATAPPPPPPPPTEPAPSIPSGSPQLIVSPAGGKLEFSCATGTSISVFNAGTGVGSFSVIVSELSASPTSGVVNPGSSVSVRVRGVGCPRDYRTSMTVIAGRQYRYDVVVQ